MRNEINTKQFLFQIFYNILKYTYILFLIIIKNN